MHKLFSKRRQDFYKQNSKYLRYVFNDHFVILLFLMMGFLMVQYAQFVRTIPENWFWGKIIVVLISLVTLIFGNLATFIEEADKQFLLPKEEEVKQHIRSSVQKSMTFPVILFFVTALILYPISAKSFMAGLWLPLLQVIILATIKYVLLIQKSNSYVKNNLLKWDKAIDDEKKRQTNILKIYSQFVDVPGIKPVVKRRKVFDGLLNFIKNEHKNTYLYLFARHFLRTGDYLGLYMRLGILSIILLFAVSSPIISLVGVLFINFILLFQLIPIKKSYDYQVLNRIYPISKEEKSASLKQLLMVLMTLLALVQTIVALFTFKKIIFVPLILIGTLAVLLFYTSRKVD